MAKQGLVRIPFYPQLNCLSQLHHHAPLLMSALLFFMTRSKEPTYCEAKHNYQLAQHLAISIAELNECFAKLKQHQLFIEHKQIIEPKERTKDSKNKIVILLSLNLVALQDLLKSYDVHIALKLLNHASDDAFDCYDVIELQRLPTMQILKGTIADEEYAQAAYLISFIAIYVNEHYEEFAFKAIAPAWKLLLNIPAGQSVTEYAQQMSERYLRTNERAIDFSFTDGNLFLPDFQEIKTPCHYVKHHFKRIEARTLCATMLLALQAKFPHNFTFISDLSEKDLAEAMRLCEEITGLKPCLSEEYYQYQKSNQFMLNYNKTKGAKNNTKQ